jgi:hypothetical protein
MFGLILENFLKSSKLEIKGLKTSRNNSRDKKFGGIPDFQMEINVILSYFTNQQKNQGDTLPCFSKRC